MLPFMREISDRFARRRYKSAKKFPKRRLSLEALEDRTVPAQLSVVSALDPVAPAPVVGTLRWAIEQANADAASGISDTIVFDTAQMGTGTITLLQGVLDLSPGSGTITINGGNQVALDGNGSSSVFVVDANAQVVFDNLTIQNGNALMGGGGINNAGSTTLNDVTLSNNSAGKYVGLDDSQGGGGIYNSGTLVVSNSTLRGNPGPYGGGICNAGQLTVINSTFSGNSASFGGGIDNENTGTLVLAGATISGNSAGIYGGGINSTGTLSLVNTIVAGNETSPEGANPDISGPVDSRSRGNIVGNGLGMTGISNGVNSNQVGTGNMPINPMLAPLGNYGGPTQTMALLPGSPAIGSGTVFAGVTTDERGEPVSSPPDIGAYQTEAVSSFSVTVPKTATAGTAFTVTVAALDSTSHIAAGYTGPVALYASDSIIPIANEMLVNGTGTFSITLDRAATVQITATAGKASGTSGDITITPGAAASLSFVGSMMGFGVTAGTPFTVDLTAQDAFGNTVTSFNGIAKLTSSDKQPVLPPLVKLVNGSGTAHVSLRHADSVTLSATAGLLQGTSNTFSVNGGAPVTLSMSTPFTVTAGTSFSVNILGRDAWGNPANDSLELHTSDYQTVSPNIVSLVDGQANPTITLDKAGKISLTAGEMNNQPVYVTSGPITIKPAAIASYRMSTPAHVTAGSPFTVTITAVDAYGNTVTGQNGLVFLSASDGETVPDINLSKGVGSASVKIDRAGALTLTASLGKIEGTGTFTVDPGTVAAFAVIAPLTVTVGSLFTVTVTALDAYSNIATNYNGTASIDCSDGQSTGSTIITNGDAAGLQGKAASVTLKGGTGTASVVLETADSVTLTVTGGNSGKGNSNPIVVNPDLFSSMVSDQREQVLARCLYNRDGELTFGDMEKLLDLAIYESGNVQNLNVTELEESINNLAADSSILPAYVENLAEKVVSPSTTDIKNLEARGILESFLQAPNDQQWESDKWQALEKEWFLGTVYPTMGDGTAGSYSNFSANTSSLFGQNGPQWSDVAQGSLGDCWYIASLSAVAAAEPSVIESMFINNNDGTYTVRFYHNGTPDYVTVNTLLPNGGTIYDRPQTETINNNNKQTSNAILWVALAEKAYAQENITGYLGSFNQGIDSYKALNSGYPDWALSAITGSSTSEAGIQPNQIPFEFALGEPVVVCTGSNPGDSNLVGNHCYAVVGYDGGPPNLPFLLFNPWGYANANSNGKYSDFWTNGAYLSQHFEEEGKVNGAIGVARSSAATSATGDTHTPLTATLAANLQSPENGGHQLTIAPSHGSIDTLGSRNVFLEALESTGNTQEKLSHQGGRDLLDASPSQSFDQFADLVTNGILVG